MPVHDWSQVDAGIFHHFHHEWISECQRALNRTLKGSPYYALAEQIAGGFGPDVLTLKRPRSTNPNAPEAVWPSGGPITLAVRPPKASIRLSEAPTWAATRQKSVAIRHVTDHNVVAVFEIVSPGNKDRVNGLSAFVAKVRSLLNSGVHVSVVDILQPTILSPHGIHASVWDDSTVESVKYNPTTPLTCATYVGQPGNEAFVEPIAVGGILPELALFLTEFEYVEINLETTYAAAFEAVPDIWQNALAS